MGGMSGVVLVAVIVFSVILAVLWVVLPFIALGIKDVLRDVRAESRRTNALLQQLLQHLQLGPDGRAAAESGPTPEAMTALGIRFERDRYWFRGKAFERWDEVLPYAQQRQNPDV